tara:strand:+ start:171 stop:278 length:108 start_codon:yes stop_codon:yes gene_type:complete
MVILLICHAPNAQMKCPILEDGIVMGTTNGQKEAK